MGYQTNIAKNLNKSRVEGCESDKDDPETMERVIVPATLLLGRLLRLENEVQQRHDENRASSIFSEF